MIVEDMHAFTMTADEQLDTAYCKLFEEKSLAVVEMNCDSLENICGCMVVCLTTLLHKGIMCVWKSFTATDQSANFSTSNDLQYTVVIV